MRNAVSLPEREERQAEDDHHRHRREHAQVVHEYDGSERGGQAEHAA